MPEDSYRAEHSAAQVRHSARLPLRGMFAGQQSCQWTVLCELAFGLGGVHAVAGDGGELLAAVVLVVNVVGDVFEILHVGPANVGTLVRLGRYFMAKSQDEKNKDQTKLLLREFVKNKTQSVFFPHFSFKS